MGLGSRKLDLQVHHFHLNEEMYLKTYIQGLASSESSVNDDNNDDNSSNDSPG